MCNILPSPNNGVLFQQMTLFSNFDCLLHLALTLVLWILSFLYPNWLTAFYLNIFNFNLIPDNQKTVETRLNFQFLKVSFLETINKQRELGKKLNILKKDMIA